MQQTQNYQGDELSIYLQNVLNPDMNIRKQAEDKINSICDQNFGQFLIELSKKISTEQETKTVRQVSATIIKNMLNKEGYSNKWFQLNEEIKTIIKNNILSTLASNDIDIRKAAALTVAGICKIEIPAKQWLNIFNTLSNTSQNENLNIQLSSLTCLEYIFEEIKQSDLPLNIVANLLNTFYSLLNIDNAREDLCYNALKAIYKFLPFIKEFVNNNESQIKFYDLIEKYVRNKNKDIREISLTIFMDIAKIYYNSLENYIEKIFNFSVSIIQEDVERNKILCMEIWLNIGYEEDYRLNVINQVKKPCLGFLQKYHVPLSELCLKYIVTEDYYSDEFNISMESFFLLSIMSRTCKDDFLKNMINYIGNAMGINEQPEKIKYSGLNVFRAIINTIYKEELYPIIKNSLKMISQILIEDNYPLHFKKLCAFILKSITKHFGEELVSDTIYFNKMIQLFLSLLQNSTKEVLYTLLMALNNLCKVVVWDEKDQTNVLSKYMQSLCDNLLQMVANTNYFDTDYNIILISFYVLGTLGERAALDIKNYMINDFKYLTDMFSKTLRVENFKNTEMALNYQEYISSTLSGFLITGMATPESAASLLKYIIETFKMRNGLYEEGILLIGNICQYTKENFNAVMQLISPYLIQGLKSTDSPDICKTSIICLSDIVTGLGVMNKYMGDFLPLIMKILSDNNIDRNLKPYCFNVISDLFMYCPMEGFKFFDNIMSVIGGAMTATKINLPDDTDPDSIKHFIDLREHLLENITCIFSAIKDINKTKEFIPYVTDIIQYISFISNDTLCYNYSLLTAGLFLIADFCVEYKGDLGPLLEVKLLKEIINKIENDKVFGSNPKTKAELDWAKKCINNVLKQDLK
jgi:importin subunit beta-1